MSLISPSKKHLTEKLSPLAVVNMIKQKHQTDIEICFQDEEFNVSGKNGMAKVWHSSIMISDYPGSLKVTAKEASKQKSRQLAAVKFLGEIYPKFYTWQMVVAEVTTKKKPLERHLPDLYLVKPLLALLQKECLETDLRRLRGLNQMISKAFDPSLDNFQCSSRLAELVPLLKKQETLFSEKLLDISLDKLIAKAAKAKDKNPTRDQLCESASQLYQTIAIQSERNLIPAIGDDLQAT